MISFVYDFYGGLQAPGHYSAIRMQFPALNCGCAVASLLERVEERTYDARAAGKNEILRGSQQNIGKEAKSEEISAQTPLYRVAGKFGQYLNVFQQYEKTSNETDLQAKITTSVVDQYQQNITEKSKTKAQNCLLWLQHSFAVALGSRW